MSLNIRLLILDIVPAHAKELADKLKPVISFVHFQTVTNIQEALEAHLENPYSLCVMTPAISDQDAEMFLKDMKKLYTQNQDNLCAFIKISPTLPANFNLYKDNPLGYATIISEKLDQNEQKKIKNAMQEFSRFKKVNEGLSDIEWTMNMILAEVDKVSNDRKRGRNTKFNTIAIDFAADLVEFDTQIMDKYFECMTDRAMNKKPGKVQSVKIPKDILKKNLPKLVEDKYSGASSRVWDKLVDKFGVEDKKIKDEK